MSNTGPLGFFVRHKVAANLLMLVMLMGGVIGLSRMNIQFFPTFALDFVTVRVVWNGAAAEDVEQAITIPLEQRLRSIQNLKNMTSTSAQGVSSITLEFREGTDPIVALDDARQQVDEFRNLPAAAEKPEVVRVARYDPIANLLLYGPFEPHELRTVANRMEDDLLNKGIDRIVINGVPEQQISIEVPNAELRRLGMSLDQLAARINAESRDLPAGQAGEQDSARELRAIEQRRDPQAFGSIALQPEGDSHLRLGDIADIRQEPHCSSLCHDVVRIVFVRTGNG